MNPGNSQKINELRDFLDERMATPTDKQIKNVTTLVELLTHGKGFKTGSDINRLHQAIQRGEEFLRKHEKVEL